MSEPVKKETQKSINDAIKNLDNLKNKYLNLNIEEMYKDKDDDYRSKIENKKNKKIQNIELLIKRLGSVKTQDEAQKCLNECKKIFAVKDGAEVKKEQNTNRENTDTDKVNSTKNKSQNDVKTKPTKKEEKSKNKKSPVIKKDNFAEINYNQENKQMIINVISALYGDKNVKLLLEKNGTKSSKFLVDLPKDKEDEYFNKILNVCNSKENIKKESLDPVIQQSMEMMDVHKEDTFFGFKYDANDKDKPYGMSFESKEYKKEISDELKKINQEVNKEKKKENKVYTGELAKQFNVKTVKDRIVIDKMSQEIATRFFIRVIEKARENNKKIENGKNVDSKEEKSEKINETTKNVNDEPGKNSSNDTIKQNEVKTKSKEEKIKEITDWFEDLNEDEVIGMIDQIQNQYKERNDPDKDLTQDIEEEKTK